MMIGQRTDQIAEDDDDQCREQERERGGSDQIELMAASTPSKELLLPAIHVYKGQDSNHISDDAKRAKSKTRVCHQTLKSFAA